MVDIHCHILPNVDDGPRSMEDSIAMAKKAVEEGIRTIIATPHHKNEKYENNRNDILQNVLRLNEALKQEKLDLTVLPGQEPRIFGELVKEIEQGDIVTLNDNSKYVLVELPSGHVPRYTSQLLFDIQMTGISPIIVHPERNQEIIEDPEILYQLVKKGALTQITTSSITGHFGKKIQKFCLQLIESNLTHFIASDAHNTTSRSFNMVEAYNLIGKKFGTDFIHLFRENAELVINGQNIYKEIPERVRKKKILRIF